jgi:hypothetical protein
MLSKVKRTGEVYDQTDLSLLAMAQGNAAMLYGSDGNVACAAHRGWIGDRHGYF